MALSARKKRIAESKANEPPSTLEHALKRQIAAAAGTEYFAERDPIYHVCESFNQSLALLGRRHSDNALFTSRMEEADRPGGGKEKDESRERPFGSETLAEPEQEYARRRFEEKTSMDGVFSPSPGHEGFLRRFSETAFNRGALSGAIMRGTGRMMLVSCLKRTVGQSQPKSFRQRMLFENASATRNINGRSPDKATFNKGDIDSAIGLTVDVTRDARRAVDSLADLAERGFEGNNKGSGTLQKMYPFLGDAKERSLLEQYKTALNGLAGPEDAQKRQIVQRAIIKTRALIAKKKQMREAFIQHLRSLSDQAAAYINIFQQEEFRAAALEALTAPPELPEDEDEEDRDE